MSCSQRMRLQQFYYYHNHCCFFAVIVIAIIDITIHSTIISLVTIILSLPFYHIFILIIIDIRRLVTATTVMATVMIFIFTSVHIA